MSLFSEIFAFVVVGDARYGRKHTPLDELNRQATKGLDIATSIDTGKLWQAAHERAVREIRP